MCAGFEVWQPQVQSIDAGGPGQVLGHVGLEEEESIEDRGWLASGPWEASCGCFRLDFERAGLSGLA